MDAGWVVGWPSFAMVCSLWLIPAWLGKSSWHVPGDVWSLVRAARAVSAGALGYMYEAGPFTGLPLCPMLMAPFVAFGDAHRFTEAFPTKTPEPTMWLLVAPVGTILGASTLLTGPRLLKSLGGRVGHDLAAGALRPVLAVLSLGPIFLWAHFEDGLALGLLLGGLAIHARGRAARGALWIGIAICAKQWAAVAVPFVVLGAPPGDRRRALAAALVPPAILAGFVLAVDWAHASSNLLSPPVYGHLGRVSPWAGSGASASAMRSGTLVVAVVAALLTRQRAPDVRVAALGVCMALRTFVELALFPYYLAPALAVLLVASVRTGRFYLTVGSGAIATTLFWVGKGEVWWWPAECAAVAATTVPAMLVALRTDASSQI